jgi:hypothetical protein
LKPGDIIEKLSKHNPEQYNLSKAVEELNELSTVLMQKFNKEGGIKEPSNQSIIDEIGDVQIRIDVLKTIFGEKLVQERILFKLTKYETYIKENKYSKI